MKSNTVHRLPMRWLERRLRKLFPNTSLERKHPIKDKCDYVLGEGVRIAVRTAIERTTEHRVFVRTRSGKIRKYSYDYPSSCINFHQHGKRIDLNLVDIFVCLVYDRKNKEEPKQVFVIPSTRVAGKTFSLHRGRWEYRGKYACFKDNWGILRRAEYKERAKHRQNAA